MSRLSNRARRLAASDSSGFTLVEMLVVMVIAGLIMSTAAWSFLSYQRAHEQNSTAMEVTSTMRNAAERSLSEGRTYCVYFNTTTQTYDTYRQDCTDTTKRVSRAKPDSSRVLLATPAFPAPSPAIVNQVTPCPVAGRCAYFYPRGTALAGTVKVTRTGSAKAYTITVEGLTSRVSKA
jgi:type II secretion system protein H